MQIEAQQAAARLPLPAAFHEFYDPNAVYGGDDAAVKAWLYERRRGQTVVAQTVVGECELSVPEQLAVELGHLLLLREDNLHEWSGLGLGKDALQQSLAIAEFGVAQTVLAVQKTVESLKITPEVSKRLEELETTGEDKEIAILLAGAVTSVLAHEGQKRLNDEPFYTHPASVATIYTIGVRTLPDWSKVFAIDKLRLMQYRALNHDAFEDRLRDKLENVGQSFLPGDTLLVSPLYHARLLASYEVGAQNVQLVVDDLAVLTKYAGPDGRMSNETYMRRFEGRVEAALIKLADITHNLKIDPKEKPIVPEKQEKWADKRAIYAANIRQLQLFIVQGSGPRANVFVAAVIPHIDKKLLAKFRQKRILKLLTNSVVLDAYAKAKLKTYAG